jgi:hypothetical protein
LLPEKTAVLLFSALMARARQEFPVFVTPHFFSAFFDDAAQNTTSSLKGKITGSSIFQVNR